MANRTALKRRRPDLPPGTAAARRLRKHLTSREETPSAHELLLFAASVVHQGPAQHLVRAVSLLRPCVNRAALHSSELNEPLREVLRSTQAALKSVRATIALFKSLRPESLELPVALRDLIAELSALTPARFHLKVDKIEGLPLPVTLGLGVIAREALVNAVQHADARRIHISLRARGEALTMTVKDDGRGFQVPSIPDPERAGLALMRDQIESLGGTLRLARLAGGGTLVTAAVPLAGRWLSSA